MFGFFRPPCRNKSYRQIYAAICARQRAQFGMVASSFVSYEAVFLYQLAVDCQLVHGPDSRTPTCCRLRSDSTNRWNLNPELADFCTHFAILLLATKVEDDIRDSGSWAARGANWWLRTPFRRCRQYFKDRFPRLLPEVERCVIEHHEMERTGKFDGINQYAAPTGAAFGWLFRSFAELITHRPILNRNCDASWFQEVGYDIGAAIIASDCLFDERKDRQRGEFNPIRSRRDRDKVLEFALSRISRIGWRCLETSGETSNVARIARYAFRRVNTFDLRNDRKEIGARKPSARWARLRRGDCDCGCDCSGCDCPTGDCGNADCGNCGAGEANLESPSCCNFVHWSISCFDCCHCCETCESSPPSQKKNNETIEDAIQVVDSKESRVGLTTITDGPLNPMGFIVIDGQRVPAKSTGEWIASGTTVMVIAENRFGLIVRAKESTNE